MELQTQQPTISIFQAAAMLFTNPSKAFALVIEQWHERQPVLLFTIYGVMMGLGGFDLTGSNGFPWMGIAFMAAIGFGTGWFFLYILAGLTQFGDRRLGATVNLDHLVTAFALAAVPSIMLYTVLFLINISAYAVDAYPLIPKSVLSGLKIAVGLSSLGLMCIANQVISKLSLVKSIIALALPLALVYGGVRLLFEMMKWI